MLIAFIRFCHDLIRQGPAHLKRVAHEWRQEAVGLPPTKTPLTRIPTTHNLDNLYMASTVARATWLNMAYAHEAAVSKALERWFSSPPVVHPQLLQELREFVHHCIERTNMDDRKNDSFIAPALGGKACIQMGQCEGGVSAAAYWHNEEVAQKAARDAIKRIQQLRPNFDVSLLADKLPKAVPLTAHLAQTFAIRQTIVESQNPRGLNVTALAITELGTKVRVASMHDWFAAHSGRVFATRTISVLKNLGCSREILKGREVTFHGRADSAVYSADLSAASDYIPHEVGQTVVNALASGMCWTDTERDAALALVGPMRAKRGDSSCLTSRGLHMGLGLTWTVLSLLNAFCAYRASGRFGSFRICGDDLVALWNERERDDYEWAIEALGLVINKSKSYYAPRGVFCERQVLTRRVGAHRIEARTESVAKIAEIVGARQTVRATGGLAVLRDQVANLITTREAYKHTSGTVKPKLPRVAKEAIRAFLKESMPKHAYGGPASLGGMGGTDESKTHPGHVAALCSTGRVSFLAKRDHREFYKAALQRTTGGPKRHDDVDLVSAAIPFLAHTCSTMRLTPARTQTGAPGFQKPGIPLPSLKIFIAMSKRLANRNSKRARLVTAAQLIKSSDKITCNAKRTALLLLHRYRHSTATLFQVQADNPGVYARIVRILAKSVKQTYLRPDDATSLLREFAVQPPMNQAGGYEPWGWEKTVPQ
jgi:hypothetical protein